MAIAIAIGYEKAYKYSANSWSSFSYLMQEGLHEISYYAIGIKKKKA